MGLRTNEFSKQLNKLTRIAIDSAVLIYHLEDVTPYSELTEILFARIAAGSVEAVFSTITLTELLVKPIADHDEDAVQAFETFVHSLPSSRWVAPDMLPPGKQPVSEPNTNCEHLTLCCSLLR